MLSIRNVNTLFFVIFSGFFISSCANIERIGHSDTEKGPNIEQSDSLPYQTKNTDEKKQAGGQYSSIINPAVEELIQQAQSQQADGDMGSAVSTIERALRISPQTPQLHLFLGELRLKQDQAHNALQLAFKGQSLLSSMSDEKLVKAFWKLIGDSYTQMGNAIKASQAYSHL